MRLMAQLFLFLCCFIACCGSPNSSWALSPQYQAAFQNGLRSIYDKHPRYKLGGNLEDGEIDCSELIRQGAIKGRLPGISKTRLQAWQIKRGHGGFAGVGVSNWKDGNTQVGDLLCIHIENGLERPDDVNHILAVILWNGIHQVMHASGSRHTVVIVPFQAWIEKALAGVEDGYRRMKLGDKP